MMYMVLKRANYSNGTYSVVLTSKKTSLFNSIKIGTYFQFVDSSQRLVINDFNLLLYYLDRGAKIATNLASYVRICIKERQEFQHILENFDKYIK